MQNISFHSNGLKSDSILLYISKFLIQVGSMTFFRNDKRFLYTKLGKLDLGGGGRAGVMFFVFFLVSFFVFVVEKERHYYINYHESAVRVCLVVIRRFRQG